MSRPSIAPSAQRNLSLTEELERLEQSITLTLQEIDANFSRAHRIVTASVIPIVQQYAQHSQSVWDSSRFWKDFFEASANISLTGYEENADSTAGADDDTLRTFDSGDTDADTTARSATHRTDEDDPTGTTDSSSALEQPRTRLLDDDDDGFEWKDDLILNSPTTTATATPRPQETTASTNVADYSSPYEQLRDEIQGTPRTPRTRPSPFVADAAPQPPPSTQQQQQQRRAPNPDPLLHRVLDKNYRVQATPRTARRSPARRPARPADQPAATRTLHPALLDSSPFSPGVEAPQLRAEIFGPSPGARRRGGAPPVPGTPRTPGVSVQARGRAGTPGEAYEIDWSDSDEEGDDGAGGFGGLSPPKTVALNLPGSRVVQTPAREASRRMVEDLVRTAGGGSVTDEMSGETRLRPEWDDGPDGDTGRRFVDGDDSPSVVRVAGPGEGGVDDSF